MPARLRALLRPTLIVAIVLVLCLPWIERAWTMLPATDTREDACLIVWVLDWVRHALATDPRTLFDPPINYPAPHQLSGSEHFLASQILFAPLRWVTGSSVAAANLTAMLSYAFAAAAMDALLRALGIASGASLVAALGYVFGWSGMAGQLLVLQSQHLFLPLTALALHRLRDRPTAWRAVGFALAFATGCLSSYHMAVFLTAGTAVWGTAELMRSRPERGRYVAAASVGAVVAMGVLVVVSLPYLARPEATGDVDLGYSRWKTEQLAGSGAAHIMPAAFVASSYVGCVLSAGRQCVPVGGLLETLGHEWTVGVVEPAAFFVPVLVIAALVAAIRRRRTRRLCVLGCGLIAVGTALAGPDYVRLGSVELPLRTLLAATPARFIRVPERALVLAVFGAAVLVASGADALLRRLGRFRVAAVLLLAVAIVVHAPSSRTRDRPDERIGAAARIVEQWGRLSPPQYFDNAALGADAESYRLTAAFVAREGAAPVLDLPATRDGVTALGQMLLQQPNVSFYTGYEPAHVSIVNRLVARLPEADALDDLVDMTRLGWIVVRDAREWPNAAVHDGLVGDLSRHPRVRSQATVGTFTVFRLDPTSRHPQWFESIAAGPRRGWSALGTPLMPLPAAPEQALLQLLVASSQVHAGKPTVVKVALTNRGTQGWAATIPQRPQMPFSVQLELRWHGSDPSAETPSRSFELDRDVPPGERLVQTLVVPAPLVPGRYRIEVAVRQLGGTNLASPRNPVFANVEVVADASRPDADAGPQRRPDSRT